MSRRVAMRAAARRLCIEGLIAMPAVDVDDEQRYFIDYGAVVGY